MTHALETKKLKKQFQSHTILHDLTFQLRQGESLSIVGPSGSGKTTLLRILAGLETPTEGRLFMNGKDITKVKANKRNVSLVFQQPLLFPHMTVKENITYGAKMAGKSEGDKIHSLLDAIEMTPFQDYYPSEISGGQKQRVALARAIATEPEVILFDEPFSSLDPKLRKDLRYWVREFLSKHSITSIFVTHDTEEAMIMGDRIALFYDGTFQQIDFAQELHDHPATPFVANFLGGHLVLDDNHYVPLNSCFLAKMESGEGTETYQGKVQHITFQNGQAIGHLYIEDLNKKIALVIPGQVKENQDITLHIPTSNIRTFRGAGA